MAANGSLARQSLPPEGREGLACETTASGGFGHEIKTFSYVSSFQIMRTKPLLMVKYAVAVSSPV